MSKNTEKDINFEESMKRLEEIAVEMENGDLSLDESLAKFEEGMKLSKKCSDILEKAERKITMLIKDSNEELVEEKFIQEEE